MQKQTDTTTPFGAPDADGADLDPQACILFEDRRFKFGLGMRSDDASIRVITGGKGAGKTHYLRRMQTALSTDPSIYVDSWRIRYPATAHVLRVWSWSGSREDCRDRWMRIWRRAVMRSTVSHLLHAPRLQRNLAEGLTSSLRDDFPELVPHGFEVPETIVHQVNRILEDAEDLAALDRYLSHRRWEAFRKLLVDAVSRTMPIFFVLDGLDEKFETAPSQWLDCQAGLLREILEFRSDHELGRHLHLIAGVRDVVYSTTQRSEHLTRVHGSPGIRRLRWDGDALRYFLEEKVRALNPADYYLRRDLQAPIPRWLGIDSIWNLDRQIEEPIDDYIIRHTRMIPRDVIQLGNALCSCVDTAVVNSEHEIVPDVIRDTVSRAAKNFGDEQLFVVANHVTADLMPREAVDYQFIESYIDTSPEEHINALGSTETRAGDEYGRAYADAVNAELRRLLRDLEEDRFAAERREDLDREFRDKFGPVDILSTLWQHRLLGYIKGTDRLQGRTYFYGPNSDDSLSLPTGYEYYALAPIVIDAVDGIRGVGEIIALS